jgi:hypothetical protein
MLFTVGQTSWYVKAIFKLIAPAFAKHEPLFVPGLISLGGNPHSVSARPPFTLVGHSSP